MLKKVNSLILSLLIISSVFAQTDGWYKDKKIRKIQFEGLKTVSQTTMAVIFDKYKGEILSDTTYLAILQSIYELEYFTSDIVTKVLPTDDTYREVNLVFEVHELPAIAGYKFIGNKRVSGADMLKVMTLKKGDIFNEAKAETDKQKVADFLISRGFATGTVSMTYTENEKENTVTIEYTITEGKQTVISQILFEGATVFTERKLKKTLASKEKSVLNQGAYQISNIQQDKLNIQMLYGEKGYVNTRVETVKEERDETSDPERNLLILTYVINEGEQFLYGGIEFIGNKIFTTEELASHFPYKEGDILNMTKVNTSMSKIADTYYENGYMTTYIEPTQSIDPVTKEVHFKLAIREGERSHIEHIIIKGNKKTRENVILRELMVSEGDVFSKSKIETSLRNLYSLQYFSAVIPEPQPGSEANLVDLIINVEEQQTANIGFGVGFSGSSDPNAFPLSASVNWNEKNFLGRGSNFDVNLKAGPNEQSLKAGYTENWFLGSPVSIGFSTGITHKKLSAPQDVLYPFGIPDPFMSKNEAQNGDPRLMSAYSMKYDRWELGFGINSGYIWSLPFARIRLGGGFNFGLVKNVYDKVHYRPFDAKIRNEQRKWSLSNSFSLQLSLDDRDNMYDPSKGWLLSQNCAFFGIIPKVENEYFFRSTSKGELYFTLLDHPVSDYWSLKFILAFYTGLTVQVPLQKAPISFDSKLAIDGMFVGRGWTTLGTESLGDVLLNHWAEFRMPLAPNILAFDFFFEAAAIKPTVQDFGKLTINDYYFSFGPGLRFLLPQFPLRLMFANTFRSDKGKPYWSNGKGPDWRFVISFNMPNN
ncbi:MAG: outer membrane protein assembly factor BamA [Treponemataceae bacterium]